MSSSTKVDTYDQTRGVCEDIDKPCVDANDCAKDVGATCSENGFCVEPSWCADGPMGVSSFKPETADMKIWVKSSIEFWTKATKKAFYANEMAMPVLYPEPGFNTFTVRDLLLLCDPPVRYEEVAELGAAIEVQFYWACRTDGLFACRPKVRVRRVDSVFDPENIGFAFSQPINTGVDKRIREQRRGIRFYFKTVGRGTKISLESLIFKMSTGGALLVLAPIVADIVMLRCMAQSKRYMARKFVITPDFDFIHDIEEDDGDTHQDDDDDMMDEQEDEEWKKKIDDDGREP